MQTIKDRIKLIILMGALLPLSVQADEPHPHAHEHGIAEMNLVVAGQDILIELQSPAYNLLGFEHPPRNAQQRQLMQQQMQAIQQGRLFKPNAAAQCHFDLAALHNPFAAMHDDHGHDKHEHVHEHEHETQHKNLSVEYTYHCQQPAQLNAIDASGLFQHWPQLQKVRVQQIIGRQQSAAELNQQHHRLSIQ